MALGPIALHQLEEQPEFLVIKVEVPKHLHEIGEELPSFVDISQENWSQLLNVQGDLMQEVAVEFFVEVGQGLPQGLGGLILRILRHDQLPHCIVVGRQAVLNDQVDVVEDELLILVVLLRLHRRTLT